MPEILFDEKLPSYYDAVVVCVCIWRDVVERSLSDSYNGIHPNIKPYVVLSCTKNIHDYLVMYTPRTGRDSDVLSSLTYIYSRGNFHGVFYKSARFWGFTPPHISTCIRGDNTVVVRSYLWGDDITKYINNGKLILSDRASKEIQRRIDRLVHR